MANETWKDALVRANEELKELGAQLKVDETEDGYYSLDIEWQDTTENYAWNYFENELDELISDARAHVKEKHEEHKAKERSIWVRVGGNVSGTKEEIEKLLNEGTGLKELIAKGNFEVCGDSYIPGPSVEDYNEAYGTDHEVDEYDVQ